MLCVLLNELSTFFDMKYNLQMIRIDDIFRILILQTIFVFLLQSILVFLQTFFFVHQTFPAASVVPVSVVDSCPNLLLILVLLVTVFSIKQINQENPFQQSTKFLKKFLTAPFVFLSSMLVFTKHDGIGTAIGSS